MSKDLLQSLEQGRTANPTLRILAGLARGLGVTVGKILAGLDLAEPSSGRGNLQTATV